MINKLISEGAKIEFREILTPDEEDSGKKSNVYVSQIFDFCDNGDLKVAMPIFKGRLIPLAKNETYDTFFYTSKGLYHCRAVVVERYKSGNIYAMEIRLKTELQKFQRRQYYRLEKTLQLMYAELSEQDYDQILETRKFPESLKDMGVYEEGNTLDISGGGMRFVGRKKVDSGKKMLVIFDINGDNVQTKFRLPARVIMSFEIPTRANRFEHRIEFENISREYRDILIKYIFEEERKIRKKVR